MRSTIGAGAWRNRHGQRRSAGRGRNQHDPTGWEGEIGVAELTAREEDAAGRSEAGAGSHRRSRRAQTSCASGLTGHYLVLPPSLTFYKLLLLSHNIVMGRRE